MFDDFMEYLESTGDFDDWDMSSYGDTFICPHGEEIEMDGECPQGCRSPMLDLGMI